ncbi:MAG: hypothetical protein H0V19_09055 [Euzebyales bacterium]|nr:hypothetical protein [Euzebyales bacterium]
MTVPPRRELFPDPRGVGLRATWHGERELVVLSLWREDSCIGTVRLGPDEATRLATFLASHLGEQTAEQPQPPPGC